MKFRCRSFIQIHKCSPLLSALFQDMTFIGLIFIHDSPNPGLTVFLLLSKAIKKCVIKNEYHRDYVGVIIDIYFAEWATRIRHVLSFEPLSNNLLHLKERTYLTIQAERLGS